MADDMNNASDAVRHYQDASTAALGERVTNLGRRQTDLESEMRTGFRAMETAIASLANETRASLTALSSSIADRSRPNIQAYGFMLSVALAVGALAYWPLRESSGDLKAAVTTLADRMVTRQEIDWRTARAAEDRLRLESVLADIRSNIIPKDELKERFQDQQRQIDFLKEEAKGLH